MFLMNLGHYPNVFGMPCLRLHDVAAWFAPNPITFGSQYCTAHSHHAPVTVQEVTEEPPE